MSEQKWWHNPAAAVGALCGEKAQIIAEAEICHGKMREYERGYKAGKKDAIIHAHPAKVGIVNEHGNCSNCMAIVIPNEKYCWHCGAKMHWEDAEHDETI